ncbi:MAG: NAD(P)H-dependent glycerol-3-phosphate dehydrogenase [Opitutales bacterium]|nr:NAD(P)H-dependent glycerol-3-phosphate dehydrogenase [Opitutales bacterium]
MNFVILGAGAWGTAMAIHLEKAGHTVSLAPRRLAQALEMSSRRENRDYLEGISLPQSLQIGWQLEPLLLEADAVLLACPSHGLREACQRVQSAREGSRRLQAVISLAKGLEEKTGALSADIIQEEIPDCAAGSLTGPTYAREVAEGKPAAMVLGMKGPDDLRNRYRDAFSGQTVRVYSSGDCRGVELGGCLKNVYAIASGVADGLQSGDNAKAALLTRSLAEMIRLGEELGANRETFYGLSGFGDLVATCFGPWSRNREFGEKIGSGERPEDLLANRKTVVEGYRATLNFHELCQEKGLEAPILEQTFAILKGQKKPQEALAELMQRDLKAESAG